MWGKKRKKGHQQDTANHSHKPIIKQLENTHTHTHTHRVREEGAISNTVSTDELVKEAAEIETDLTIIGMQH